MKRRVLRAHANKRRLRLLSAEHGLRLDAYNVLCDASFLRAIAQVNNNNNNNARNSNSSNNSSGDRGPVQMLRSLMYETFAAATSHVTPGSGNTLSAAVQEKKVKDLSLSLFYLPETATTLRRMVQQEEEREHKQHEQEKEKDLTRKEKSSEKKTGKLPVIEVKNKRKGGMNNAVESLLTSLECIEHHNDTTTTASGASTGVMRNEAKSIVQFLTAVAAGEEQPQRVQGKKNAHFFFVATQSHDVRRLLPGNAALIRLTTSPTALWIEKNSDAFHYDKNGMNDSNNGIGGKKHNREGALANTSLTGTKQLSAADLAFMRHLSVDHVPNTSRSKRHRLETSVSTTVAPTPTPTSTPFQGMNDKKKANGNIFGDAIKTKKKSHFNKKGESRPNPLSVKKKRVREVFRVECGTQKK